MQLSSYCLLSQRLLFPGRPILLKCIKCLRHSHSSRLHPQRRVRARICQTATIYTTPAHLTWGGDDGQYSGNICPGCRRVWPQLIHATRGDDVNVGSTGLVLALVDHGYPVSKISPEGTDTIYVGMEIEACFGAYTYPATGELVNVCASSSPISVSLSRLPSTLSPSQDHAGTVYRARPRFVPRGRWRFSSYSSRAVHS